MVKLFRKYLIVGFLIAIMLEVINGSTGNPGGIGLISFFLIMILYYQIFPRGVEK